MSSTRLPSLNALRAFEAAARHGSLSRAAAELHVTHSAVSHQIKALEAELGVPLFRRVGRGVEANAVGQQLEAALSDAFARIGRAVLQARHGDRAGILTVSVEPSFAVRWLVLRLGRFRSANPEIDLRLSATGELADFSREDVDAAIRHGRGGWAGLEAERLMDARVFPVCSPGLLANGPPLSRPEDLRHHTLLHEDNEHYWREWLTAAGAAEVEVGRGPRFDDGHLALAAAGAGQGVALTDDALAAAELAEGRLVRLFATEIGTDKAYWLVYPPAAATRPKVAAFRAWLLAEVGGRATRLKTQGLGVRRSRSCCPTPSTLSLTASRASPTDGSAAGGQALGARPAPGSRWTWRCRSRRRPQSPPAGRLPSQGD